MARERLEVLLVEESSSRSLALSRALSELDARFVTSIARSEADALDRLERLAVTGRTSPLYDAVVVDLGSCSMRPFEFIGQLCQILPSVPVLAICSSNPADQRQGALRSGAVVAIPSVAGDEVHTASIVRLCIETCSLRAAIDQQRVQLTELASRDELTDLANRRRFNEVIENEIERARRYHRPVTLVLVDLDALKLVNDTHGHAAGDAALCHVASSLRGEIRRFETAARLGGDEFAVLLVDTNYDQGITVAEKLRQRIADHVVPGVGQVTVSAGLASFPAHAEGSAELIRMADQALYDAKSQGRDRIVVSRALRQERLGQRHPVRFRVVVSGRNNRGETFTEETETELISRHGARILSTQTVTAGEQIQLRTPFHERPLRAQITACYRAADERWRVGFKLIDPPRWSG